MIVRELSHPTKAEFEKIVQVLQASFWRTPLFREYLFQGREAISRTFIKALTHYSVRSGRVFIAEEGQNFVAVALWSLPGSPAMGLKGYLETGMAPQMLSIALQSPAAMGRIRALFRFLEIHAPEFPCNTLEFLASVKKGAGAELLRACLPRLSGFPLYVESIVSKNDHAFYRQFGFEPYAREVFHGTEYAFALIREACVGQD